MVYNTNMALERLNLRLKSAHLHRSGNSRLDYVLYTLHQMNQDIEERIMIQVSITPLEIIESIHRVKFRMKEGS